MNVVLGTAKVEFRFKSQHSAIFIDKTVYTVRP